MIEVTFQALGKSQRIWSAVFDLGDETENAALALKVAFTHNAMIVRSSESDRGEK